MQWTGDGIILGCRRYGETSVILELMTRGRGRHLGLVRGGRSRRYASLLQPGNSVHAVWRGRLDEHLGSFQVEPMTERAGRLMETALGLYGVTLLAAHLRLLPERDPHPALHDAAVVLLDALPDPDLAPALMVRFELLLLAELGFGLDLEACAATGSQQDLVYVSPKSGRAVSRLAGEPYRDRLLALPAFLTERRVDHPTARDLHDGFGLTGHFLDREVYDARGLRLPEAREGFINAVRRIPEARQAAE